MILDTCGPPLLPLYKATSTAHPLLSGHRGLYITTVIHRYYSCCYQGNLIMHHFKETAVWLVTILLMTAYYTMHSLLCVHARDIIFCHSLFWLNPSLPLHSSQSHSLRRKLQHLVKPLCPCSLCVEKNQNNAVYIVPCPYMYILQEHAWLFSLTHDSWVNVGHWNLAVVLSGRDQQFQACLYNITVWYYFIHLYSGTVCINHHHTYRPLLCCWK